MKQKIIIDTSIWIDYFKNKDSSYSSKLDSLLLTDCVYINGIILAEILQGIKGEDEKKVVSSLLEALHFLDITIYDWKLAGEISGKLRAKGITLPLTDISIAANAINNNAVVFTIDKHFEMIDYPKFKILR